MHSSVKMKKKWKKEEKKLVGLIPVLIITYFVTIFSSISRHFHQRFTRMFFVQNFGAKNYKAVFWVWHFLALKYQQKNVRKMLMKSTPVSLYASKCITAMLYLSISVKTAFSRSTSKLSHNLGLKHTKYNKIIKSEIIGHFWNLVSNKHFDC